MDYIKDYVTSTAAGFLRTGIGAAGTVAGNAVGGVGGLIENGGRSVGDGVTSGIQSFGNYINSYGSDLTNSMAADGPVSAGTMKKTAIKPSKSPKAVSSTGPVARKPVPKALPIGSAKGAYGSEPLTQLDGKRRNTISSKSPGRPNTSVAGLRPKGEMLPRAATAGGSMSFTSIGQAGADVGKAKPQANKVPSGRVKASPKTSPRALRLQPVSSTKSTTQSRLSPAGRNAAKGTAQKDFSREKVGISRESRPKPKV